MKGIEKVMTNNAVIPQEKSVLEQIIEVGVLEIKEWGRKTKEWWYDSAVLMSAQHWDGIGMGVYHSNEYLKRRIESLSSRGFLEKGRKKWVKVGEQDAFILTDKGQSRTRNYQNDYLHLSIFLEDAPSYSYAVDYLQAIKITPGAYVALRHICYRPKGFFDLVIDVLSRKKPSYYIFTQENLAEVMRGL